jgi:hypothetical protein
VRNGTGFSEAQILAGRSRLKHVVGDLVIRRRGAVISHEWIEGCVSIEAKNVTIKDSLIHCVTGAIDGLGHYGAFGHDVATRGTPKAVTERTCTRADRSLRHALSGHQ